MPKNFLSKVFPTSSASCKPAEGYQIRRPYFVAASISAGVIACGGGALARTGAAYALTASAADILRSSRRDNGWRDIMSLVPVALR